ncbi:pheromone-regulated protein PRM4 NDAI_0K01350 [Naumovozyma dairenensis CBS 421]|uniref:Uncharacterized protein n=1 Tax=Naumovozyma dairenensis (strain ATCC 10597 / BCRC 20456 / CBS 421 / NBRC 0211 / NRRL Y-12639) TaxID=1071378 RepID=G0WHR5_NAUDC|nr:hypothetical protein NDAI_0K01350 [Naumovozyma dairenensis CBS 421]CCD27326.1 hypothetical protein NDAI_0K01350 [Naumovozyma dairenensis CBS 421]
MGTTKIPKQIKSRRNTRIISITVILLTVMGLLIFEWSSDYTFESSLHSLGFPSLTSSSSSSSGNQEEFIPSSLLSKPVQESMKTDNPVEENDNLLKVWKEISDIKKELSKDEHILKKNDGNDNSKKLKDSQNVHLLSSTSFNAEDNFKQILNTSPAVLFIKSSEWDSQYLKNLLSIEYEISPQLAIVDLEKHSNGNQLLNYIKKNKLLPPSNKASSTPNLPYLFINGVSIINNGLSKDIKQLHSNGHLLNKLKSYSDGHIFFEKKNFPSNS